MHTSISASEAIRFGWETFKKRPWFFIGAIVIVFLISSILSAVGETGAEEIGSGSIILILATLVINIFIEMGLIAFALKAHDDVGGAAFANLWHPASFLPYVGVKILTALAVLLGLVLLIVPGIIAALALMFATYLVIDRKLGVIEALKESARLTKGNRWNLLILMLALVGINILGALALLVGLLVSVPVSLLAIAHAYRTLSHLPHEERVAAPVSA